MDLQTKAFVPTFVITDVRNQLPKINGFSFSFCYSHFSIVGYTRLLVLICYDIYKEQMSKFGITCRFPKTKYKEQLYKKGISKFCKVFTKPKFEKYV